MSESVQSPKVGIVMGSNSDWDVMKEAAKKLVVDCWEAELPYR